MKTCLILLLYPKHGYTITNNYETALKYQAKIKNTKNREQKRGSVAHLKEELYFKIREDWNRLDKTIEQLWLEIKWKKLEIIYFTRDSLPTYFANRRKIEWLDKIEIMLSIIASTFTGTIILAGDTNINANVSSRF